MIISNEYLLLLIGYPFHSVNKNRYDNHDNNVCLLFIYTIIFDAMSAGIVYTN